MKKALSETQTLLDVARRSQKFSPPPLRRPPSRGHRTAKL